MRLAVILLAAGAGVRLEAGQPKAFARVAGRTVLEHAYDHVARHPAVDRVIVTAPMSAAERVAALIPREARVVAGGATRQESVRLALGLLEADAKADPDADPEVHAGADAEPTDRPVWVLVHDAARALVPVEVVDRVVAALVAGADAVVPALAVADTIKRVDSAGHVLGTPDRRELRAVQTPQGFRLDALLSAHRYARTAGLRDVTDDAALVERHGGRVVVVDGSPDAFKITIPRDLQLAELVLREAAASGPGR